MGHEYRDMPVGIDSEGERVEFDSMGQVRVPADRYWGAQTARSLTYFAIGEDRMPIELCRAYGYVKKASAAVNLRAGLIAQDKHDAIAQACEELIAGELDDHFPLRVWQTGSGTQTNMNVNEVVANRAIQLLGGELGSQKPVAPNDNVNKSQSSNDSFVTAMHLAAIGELDARLLPEIAALADAIETRADEWMDRPKIGRTHLQDAVPLSVGQEWSAWAEALRCAIGEIESAREGLMAIALGGTAVGTGLNAPDGFSEDVAEEIARLTRLPVRTATNKFHAQATLDPMVKLSASLRGLAVSLIKIANDVRWLASGPRCGIGELNLPQNEPGSSIMPGKVNPTQSEALMMVAMQVIGHDSANAMAGSFGNLQLNAMRPVVAANILHSIRLLADGCGSFREHAIEGTRLDDERIEQHLDRSLMLVTALVPEIGYLDAAHIAEAAAAKGTTLREEAIASGKISEKDYDRLVQPASMIGEGLAGA
ncbi:class II fumarate hydratase [Alteriqipengyuania lutimaris]|uniref:Fumarate hydratase class II n=1 Tax=Alteriqipengyuania lutimaris TaxID=1538146 RepID=A0A395LLZ4_9SPHN|nr:class II fumarate hydratase [Alteriqipengyuania lutimaris]MBB3033595.1 fumarate hydratase class II [Alteriqipengyuania lutimaris]RDS77407.1 class II fumarate hydratase [Alteriqipengyuania lutimaris]